MAAMSGEAGVHQSFVWENQSWALSISDNNSGGSQERLLGMKKAPPPTSSNSPTEMASDVPRNINNKMKREGRGGGDKGSSSSGDNKVMKEGKGTDGHGGGESDDHEIHIWTERERRKKMRNMFANLHALLPQLPPKADKSTIVDEAVNYIKTLQQTLQKLQKQKLERLQGVATLGYEKLAFNTREGFLADQVSSTNLAIDATSNSTNLLSASSFPVVFQTWTSSNVVLNICGDEAHISVCSPKKLGLFTTICYVLEKHKIEVMSAQVSSHSARRMYMIQAHVNRASDRFTEAVPVEEIYKQAAGELMFWISS